MHVLPFEKKCKIIACLVEGASIRSTERLTGVHRDTIMRLGVATGEACADMHDALMRDLNVSLIQLDEVWGYVAKKQKNVGEDDPEEMGDSYTYTALAVNQRALISYRVGKRSPETTNKFVADLHSRILNRPQITTDGFLPYPEAIEGAFGGKVDYATLVKHFQGSNRPESQHRYSPGRIRGISKHRLAGNPREKDISTSLVERSNLTLRMHQRRWTRLTNAFSKKLRNHKAAFSLFAAWYNWCRVHESLRVTPAMELGISNAIWSLEDLVEISEDFSVS